MNSASSRAKPQTAAEHHKPSSIQESKYSPSQALLPFTLIKEKKKIKTTNSARITVLRREPRD